MTLSCQNLSVGYQTHTVLKQINLDFPEGKITTIIGANGCGKSTLLKALSGQIHQYDGQILLDGQPLSQYAPIERAKRMALLPQKPEIHAEISVESLIRMGRFPHQSFLQQWREEDEEAVLRAMQYTDTLAIKDQYLSQLSGGQQQRTWIALTLAQSTPSILLDEPINHLDLKYQLQVLELLKRLNQKENKTIILVLHDINLAARYAHNMVALANGHVIAAGAPTDILTPNLIKDTLGLRSQVMTDPVFGTPLCIPIPQNHPENLSTTHSSVSDKGVRYASLT